MLELEGNSSSAGRAHAAYTNRIIGLKASAATLLLGLFAALHKISGVRRTAVFREFARAIRCQRIHDQNFFSGSKSPGN
jgi:hypothetical protein